MSKKLKMYSSLICIVLCAIYIFREWVLHEYERKQRIEINQKILKSELFK
jgi:hypothetical protein